MKALKLSRRIVLIVLAVVFALALLISASYYFLVLRPDQKKEDQNISQTNREALMVGGCSDEGLHDAKAALEAQRGKPTEGAAMEDLGSCYEFRNDKQNARQTYEQLASWQEANGQPEAAEITKRSVKNIDVQLEFEKNPPTFKDEDLKSL